MTQTTNSKSNITGAKVQEERPVDLRAWLAVLGSALGAFMAVLDIQITNSSLPNIQGALGAGIDEGSWISTAYLIAEIVTIPLTSFLSRVFSVKRYVITNAILFVLFSVSCALARDLGTMIAARAAQGFTGGTLIPMAFTMILAKLPPSKRPIGLAIFSVTAVFAPSIGPAIGGYLTDNFGWEYIFYLNLVPGIVLVSLLWYSLDPEPTHLELLKEGDWFGILFMAMGLGHLEYFLEEGQRKDWFGSPVITHAAEIAAVSLVILLIIELRIKKPILHLRLLRRRNFGLGSITNIALGFALYGSVFLLPLYLAEVHGYSAWQIGEVMIWSGAPQLLIVPFIPKLMQKIDPRLMMGYGLALFGASCLLNAFMSHDYAGPQLTLALLVRALGQPFVMVPNSSVSTAEIEHEEAASASALFNMMRNLGGSVGIAVCSTCVTQREQFHSSRIGESVTSYTAQTRQQLTQLSSLLRHRGASSYVASQQATKVLDNLVRREANVMAFNDTFLLLACILFLACISIFFLKKPNLKELPAGE